MDDPGVKEMSAEEVLSPWLGPQGAGECRGMKVAHTQPRVEAKAGFKMLQASDGSEYGRGSTKVQGQCGAVCTRGSRGRRPWQGQDTRCRSRSEEYRGGHSGPRAVDSCAQQD